MYQKMVLIGKHIVFSPKKGKILSLKFLSVQKIWKVAAKRVLARSLISSIVLN